MYPPGPWGANRPVPDAKIRITDLDAPGRTDDLIWEGVTGPGGVFQGTSKEWQDRITLTPGVPATPFTPAIPPVTGPDPSDILILKIEIEHGSRKLSAPFAFAGDGVQVPVFVTWTPPAAPSHGTLNGAPFTDFEKLSNALVDAIVKRQPVELKLYGDWSAAATPLVAIIGETPLQRVRRVFPQSRAGSIVLVIGGTSITISAAAIAAAGGLVLAIAFLVLMAGASTFLVCLGVAVILAVVNGYMNIEASQKTTTDSQGNPNNETTIVLRAN